MQDQKEVWDKIAASWNEHRTKVTSEAYDFLKDETGKILDIGCGSGRNFLSYPMQELYAIDFSFEMIKLAKENAKKKGIDVELSVMNATNLRFEENFFDAVLCNAVLHCIPSREDRINVLSEIFRVLKKIGRAHV